jgi:hypothetical protein
MSSQQICDKDSHSPNSSYMACHWSIGVTWWAILPAQAGGGYFVEVTKKSSSFQNEINKPTPALNWYPESIVMQHKPHTTKNILNCFYIMVQRTSDLVVRALHVVNEWTSEILCKCYFVVKMEMSFCDKKSFLKGKAVLLTDRFWWFKSATISISHVELCSFLMKTCCMHEWICIFKHFLIWLIWSGLMPQTLLL